MAVAAGALPPRTGAFLVAALGDVVLADVAFVAALLDDAVLGDAVLGAALFEDALLEDPVLEDPLLDDPPLADVALAADAFGAVRLRPPCLVAPAALVAVFLLAAGRTVFRVAADFLAAAGFAARVTVFFLVATPLAARVLVVFVALRVAAARPVGRAAFRLAMPHPFVVAVSLTGAKVAATRDAGLWMSLLHVERRIVSCNRELTATR